MTQLTSMEERAALRLAKGGTFDAPDIAAADARDGTTITRPLTEQGNAQRLADLHGGKVYSFLKSKHGCIG